MIRFLFLNALILFSSASLAGGVKLNSDKYILVDYSTMQVLEAKNENERMSPASLTKVMTAYILFDYISKGLISKDDMVEISGKSWKASGSRMFLEVGKKVTVDDLINGLIVQSGNDAAISIAEHISGDVDSFADVMNMYASKIGMHNSFFENATGRPSDKHYTTMKDLSLLAYRMIKDFPDSLNYYSKNGFEFNKIYQKSSNKMLSSDNFDGMQTGFTEKDGYSFIGSAAKNKKRMIFVTSGAKSSKDRFVDSEILEGHFFDNFNEYKVADKFKIINEATTYVLGGDVNFVRAGVVEDVTFLLSNINKPTIKIELKMDKSVKAPVSVGQRIGSFNVYINDMEAKSVDVVTVESVGIGSNHKVFFESINSFIRGVK